MFLKLPFAVSFSVLFLTIQYAVFFVNHLECFTCLYEYIYICTKHIVILVPHVDSHKWQQSREKVMPI